MSDGIFLGGGGTGYADAQQLLLEYANRHGLIAGATGTGKTVTLQILAEGFSSIGVPVFLSDVKGDLSGLANQEHLNSSCTHPSRHGPKPLVLICNTLIAMSHSETC